MRHYTIERWADFARNVVKEREKKEMLRHLESGCRQCARLVDTWKQVRDAARRETAYQPPNFLVRSVKGMGAIHGLNKDRQAKLSVAELLFDSFRSPMPAGVRSASVTARQMLFGAGNYRLDLRIEPLEDSDKVALLGQILNSSEPDEPIGIVAVVLRRGNKVLAQSVTNLFGEFELEFNLENSLQLHAHLPQGQVVRVPLVEPIGDVAARGPGADDSRGVTPPFRKPNKSTRKKV